MGLRIDPCGIICCLITYSAVLYADYVVTFWISLYSFYDSLWAPLHVVFFNLVVSFLTVSHLRAVLSDPGLVSLPQSRIDFSDYQQNLQKNDPNSSEWSICNRCEAYRPPRAHHCRICKRCVKKMDHHCPWINNCVGEYNQKYFIQFLFYVGLLSAYAMGLVVFSWMKDGRAGNCLTEADCPKEIFMEKQNRILHSVILMLECVLFGLFVLAILIDQFSAIFSDETAVEQVKNRGSKRSGVFKRSKMALLREVFRTKEVYSWFIPCSGHDPATKLPINNHLDV